jgi:glycerol kinase
LGIPVERPTNTETTVLGAAILAGLQIGLFESTDDVQKQWQCDQKFEVTMPPESRDQLLQKWRAAVDKVKT